jgi:hypothetical protein
MLVRFIPDLEDKSLGELFSPISLNNIFFLTPGKIYQSVGITKNKPSEIKRGRPSEFIKLVNDRGEIIELGLDSRWFLPIQQERDDKISKIIDSSL